jgi:hypothetical protein
MAKARQREAWGHTSLICAVVASYAFGAKRARRPAEFNPCIERVVVKMSPKESLDALGAFASKRKRR